jgi:primosomal protein N' (replication factor Y)
MAAIRNTLTYLVPDSLTIQPGQRVQVPLATRKATGIVLRSGSTLPPGIQARPILRVLDDEPVLSMELLDLGLWIADYYVAPIGEVFRAMLPLRSSTRRARTVRLSAVGQQRLQEINQASEEPATPEGDLLNYLAMRGSASVQVLRQRFSEAFLQALKEKWVVVEEVERERTQRQVYTVRVAGPVPEKPLRLSPVAK